MLECLCSLQGRSPNLVVFLADDAGWGDYSLHGNQTLQTPRLDALAQSGARFEQFYVCALCAPTRAEYLTGRYHSRGGVLGVSEGQERLDLDETTLAEPLQKAGYRTGIFGKWHNGSQWPYHPLARGFDEFVGYTSGHWGEYFDAPLEENGRMISSKGYIVDVLVDRALGFIRQQRERPFFCYIPLTTPHSPFSVPDEYWRRFAGRKVAQLGPDGAQEDLDLTRCVYAMMSHLDDAVGRVLDELCKLGLERDTLVVWFSDNGPNSGRWNAGLKGRKGQVDEGGLKSPLWISWPGKIKSGTVVKDLSAAIDLRPSLLALLGVADHSPLPLDGRDFSPALLGKALPTTSRTLFQYNSGRLSLRTENHRLDATGALFDLRVDPLQAGAPCRDQEGLRQQLLERGSQWHQEVFAKPALFSPAPLKGKGKAGRGGLGGSGIAVDPRPYTVGYREFPLTMLEARDGLPHGEIKRSSSAPNCSYFVNWTAAQGNAVSWKIEVRQSGRYEVSLDYACAPGNAGCVMELEFAGRRVAAAMDRVWYPPLHDGQDRVPRKGESVMRSFEHKVLGQVELEAGRGTLLLRAKSLVGPEAIELRRLNLKLLPES